MLKRCLLAALAWFWLSVAANAACDLTVDGPSPLSGPQLITNIDEEIACLDAAISAGGLVAADLDTSAEIAAIVGDETGSGALVFGTSPTLVTPNLGTPSAITLTNGTGLPISTGVSGLGTGVATWLATPSSANLAAAITNETGSGVAVFATSPALVTPDLGTPSAATLTNATGLPISGLTASTSTAIGVGTVELGHASDTTLARSGAGAITLEGVAVPTISSTSTLTNKTISGANNTLSNISGASLTDDTVTVAKLDSTDSPNDEECATYEGGAIEWQACGSGSLPADPGYDALLMWDDSDTGNETKWTALASVATEGTPATGDFVFVIRDDNSLAKVDWADLPGAGAGISNVSEDTDPELGGGLDLNSFDITGTGNVNVTGDLQASDDVIVGDDVLIATLGVINFGAGEVTVTETDANTLTIAGTTANNFSGTVTAATDLVATAGDVTSGDDLISGDDVLLSNAGVINWNSGDCTLTEGTDTLTLAGTCTLITEVHVPDGDNTRDLGSAAATWAATHTTTIELGNNTDTTLARSGAGVATLEGVEVTTNSGTQTLTNKSIVATQITAGALNIGNNAATVGTLELGNGTDATVARTGSGEATLEGDAIKHAGKQMFWIGAGAFKNSALNPASCGDAYDSGSNDVSIYVCAFDAGATEENAEVGFAMPKGWNEGTITMQIAWTNTGGASTETVQWKIACTGFGDDDALNTSYPADVTISDTWLAQNDYHLTAETSAITVQNAAEGDWVNCRFGRDTSVDNMAGDALFIGAKVYWTDNASTLAE